MLVTATCYYIHKQIFQTLEPYCFSLIYTRFAVKHVIYICIKTITITSYITYKMDRYKIVQMAVVTQLMYFNCTNSLKTSQQNRYTALCIRAKFDWGNNCADCPFLKVRTDYTLNTIGDYVIKIVKMIVILYC